MTPNGRRRQSAIPDDKTPTLEAYQTDDDALRIVEAGGPMGAWIETSDWIEVSVQ